MGDITTEKYASWEDGFNKGFKKAVKILMSAKKLEDLDIDPKQILDGEWKKIKVLGGN